MPFKSKHYCSVSNCPNLIESGQRYCTNHKQPITEQEKERTKINNKIYGNTTWRRLRRIKLSRDPLCVQCLAIGRVVSAGEVDHIKSVKEYPELRLVYDNLQSLCETHHSQKTRAENKR